MTETRNPDPLDWTPNNAYRPAEYAGPVASEAMAAPSAVGAGDVHRTRWQLAVGLTAGALLAGAVGGLAGASLNSPTTGPAAEAPVNSTSTAADVGGPPGHLPPAGDDDGASAAIAED